VITVWLLSLMVLVVSKDLGTSLMYFGMFVVTLYIATERVSWLIIGLLLFFGGAFAAYVLGGTIGGPFANFHERALIWLDPFGTPQNQRATHAGFQLVQSLLGLGTGGLFGAGPGAGQPLQVPEVRTDFIFAGMGEEIGLFGLTALLVVYLLIVERGLRAALGVRDSFGKLFAGGLAFTLGLQVFVIVGGVSELIPLTGQTTPFLSAGGSSLMANWLLVGLLLRISDAGRRPAGTSASIRGSAGPVAGPGKLQDLPTEVVR
jgi:cell division protein FtsW (lipid II flippase)